MSTRHLRLRSALIVAALVCGSTLALAMPKAAEDESAVVSTGADAARPKHAAAAKPAAKPGSKPASKATAKAPAKAKKSATHTTNKPVKTGKAGTATHPAKPAAHAKSAPKGKGGKSSAQRTPPAHAKKAHAASAKPSAHAPAKQSTPVRHAKTAHKTK